MSKFAIIGGTGLTSLNGLQIKSSEKIDTPFGAPSADLTVGELSGREIVFLPRHGGNHTIPPHKINYRANLWALKQYGVENIIAVNAVGGVRADMAPGRIIVPDQIIDYTHSRINTFFEEGLEQVTHIDFTEPYCEALRQRLIAAGGECGLQVIGEGTYAATQGPRLESAAEINRLERDGCDLVGMTGMPEAALARELELCYACISVVANMGAGRSDEELTMEMIERTLVGGMADVRRLLEQLITTL